MEIDEKRQLAKSLKIRNWHNKKEENLDKEIAAIQGEKVEFGLKVDTKEDKKGYLKRAGFNFEAMKQYANELGATKAVYRRRKNVFECSREEQLIDNLHISMFN